MVVRKAKFFAYNSLEFTIQRAAGQCCRFAIPWDFSLFCKISHNFTKCHRSTCDLGIIKTNSNRYREVFSMNIRNEIKAQIVRAGMTMQEVVDQLSIDYGWSESVSNLSGKLQRESIRYKEVLELAAVLGYDIVWKKRGER